MLSPVARLQQVVRLEHPLVASVREPGEHAVRVEIPDRSSRHHIQPIGPEDAEVNGGIGLLHETVLLCPRADPAVERQRADEPLHEELAGEGQHDDVEGHEGEVEFSLAIVGRGIGVGAGVVRNERVVGGERVGEEDGAVQRIGGGRIESVKGEGDDDEDERVEPGVLKGVCLPPSDPAADLGVGFPTFGVRAGKFGLGVALRRRQLMISKTDALQRLTGDRGGETKVGVGSKVERDAPVSPLSPVPRLLCCCRRGRGMLSLVGDSGVKF